MRAADWGMKVRAVIIPWGDPCLTLLINWDWGFSFFFSFVTAKYCFSLLRYCAKHFFQAEVIMYFQKAMLRKNKTKALCHCTYIRLYIWNRGKNTQTHTPPQGPPLKKNKQPTVCLSVSRSVFNGLPSVLALGCPHLKNGHSAIADAVKPESNCTKQAGTVSRAGLCCQTITTRGTPLPGISLCSLPPCVTMWE